VPAYTLEALDQCDVDRLIPYYLWDYRKALISKSKEISDEGEAVYRDGKLYKKVVAKNAEWAKSMF
jgi:hypothetical protein